MIELLQILFFSILFTSFFYLPYYKVLTLKNKIYLTSLADKNILNILIIGNFLLILSFFNITLSNIIKLFYLYTFFSFFIFWKDFKNLNKNFFYYLFFFHEQIKIDICYILVEMKILVFPESL